MIFNFHLPDEVIKDCLQIGDRWKKLNKEAVENYFYSLFLVLLRGFNGGEAINEYTSIPEVEDKIDAANVFSVMVKAMRNTLNLQNPFKEDL